MTSFRSFILIISFFLSSAALQAQSETSEVLGTVRDNTGGVVTKATVTLAQQDTGLAAGFTKFTATDVTVNVKPASA